MVEYLELFKGDDTDFSLNQAICIKLVTDYDLAGCTAHVKFYDYEQTFYPIVDKKLPLSFPGSVTSKFPLGRGSAKIWLTEPDPEGSGTRRRTVANDLKILVTNNIDLLSRKDISYTMLLRYDYKDLDSKPMLNGKVIEGDHTDDYYDIKGPAPDKELSEKSENAVQNKVIAGKFKEMDEAIRTDVNDIIGSLTLGWGKITGKPFEGQEIDIGTDDKVLAALGTIIEKLGGTVKASIALVALCAMSAFGYTPETHNNSFEIDGVTYAQRGGLGVGDYVVTNIDVDAQYESGKFASAVVRVSPPVELPEKWALANVTNANAESVRASDVGALGNSGSQTLNQSYGGLSVNFDSKGTLYTGQYAPSRWSIIKEVNDQYYYVQFFGFSGTNYPSFNLFDGESDFYIRLPRKEGTLALQSDVGSKADKPALPVTAGNLVALTADGNLSDSGIAKGSVATKNNLEGYLPLTGGTIKGDLAVNYSISAGHNLSSTFFSTSYSTSWGDVVPALYYSRWYYLPNGSEYPKLSDNEIAVKGDISALSSSVSGLVDSVSVLESSKLDVAGGTVTGDLEVVKGITVRRPSNFTGKLNVNGLLSAKGVMITNGTLRVESEGYTANYKGDSWDIGFDSSYVIFDYYDWWEFDLYDGVSTNEWFVQLPRKDGTLATLADIPAISATNPTFSSAVLAVNLDFTTNTTGAAYVAVTNALAGFGFDAEALAELPGGKVYGSIGALLAALAAAVAWLKKKALVGGLTGGVPDDPKVHDFFTNSNSLLTGTIDARLPYPLYAVPSTGLLKDRAINTTSLASVTVPENFTDLIVRASVASSLSVTMPEAIATKYGDTFPGEAGEYLITITKTGAAEAYVRTIKLEEVA